MSDEVLKSEHKIGSLWLGMDFYLVICDPDVIDNLSKECLEKPEIVSILGRFLTGNGTIFAPANIWRTRRKLMMPSFSQKNLNNFVNVFSQCSIATAARLKAKCDGGDFSVWSYFITYSMNAICETGLGLRGQAKAENNAKLLEAFEEYINCASDLAFRPWCYVVESIFRRTADHKTLTKNKNIMTNIINEIIQDKRNKIRESGNKLRSDGGKLTKGDTDFSILDYLLENYGDTMTDLELLEEILVLAVGGTDTSTVAVCFTAILLSKHPDVQEKVYQEVKEVMGDTIRPIDYNDLPKLKYLEAVLKEALRLYPSAPFVGRLVDKDVTLPSGKFIPKGTTVGFNMWGMHRHPKYWGDDPERFDPERFINPNITHPVAYIPFSYGPRNCIGGKYAMLSLKTLLATLLSRYEILPPASLPPDQPFRIEYKIMLKDVNNFQIRLKKRELECKLTK
ncbi:unnamed protein product [Leptosia nina]|uniref:Cytochrome P450 n=1 Tax=Leptosia nina TaxID=320188 RepID=A0AAV1JSG1_9NEOP